LIHIKGYNNTGIKEILDKADVPKGSFYHYFKSKEDLALNILDYHASIINNIFAYAIEENKDNPFLALRCFFEVFHKKFEELDYFGGCPLGNLSQELSDTEENIRIKVDTIFNNIVEKIAVLLEKAKDMEIIDFKVDSRDYAQFIFNSWEGAILRAKTMKNRQSLDIFMNIIFEKMHL
jgi:TetR/AcrR family transcriptional repressor of nem operon